MGFFKKDEQTRAEAVSDQSGNPHLAGLDPELVAALQKQLGHISRETFEEWLAHCPTKLIMKPARGEENGIFQER